MDKIIVISGVSSGLGKELAIESIQRGYKVCGISRSQDKLDDLKKLLGDNFNGYKGDVSSFIEMKDILIKIAKLGEIKVLVNNAQKVIFKEVGQYESDDIKENLKGLEGMINLTEATLRVKDYDLKIVNIGSSSSFTPKAKESVYCAVKWGERGYTDALKEQFKGSDVKVIGVYPGGMNTSFWDNNRNYMAKEKTDNFMNANDVAKVILDNILIDSLTVSDLRISRF